MKRALSPASLKLFVLSTSLGSTQARRLAGVKHFFIRVSVMGSIQRMSISDVSQFLLLDTLERTASVVRD